MVISLTGGAGFVGSHTALALLERGESVLVLDNLSNASCESLRRIEKLTGKTVAFYIQGMCAISTVCGIFLKNILSLGDSLCWS